MAMITNINADFIIGAIRDCPIRNNVIYKALGHNDNFTSNIRRNGVSDKDLHKLCAILELDESDPRLYVDEAEYNTREWTELRKIRSQMAITNARLKRVLKVLDIEDVEQEG